MRDAVDLHTHSTCSDGALTPRALIARAAAAGIGTLALTDHDTTAGLAEAAVAARLAGITLVPGIELSASWRAQTIHIVGLGIDPEAPALRSVLDAQAARRQRRLEQMCARLTRLGLPGESLRRAVESVAGIPTRTHLAAALTAAGHVRAAEEAFRRYLAAGKPAHVSAGWPGIESIVASIVSAGGCAVLAHPARYRLSAGARQLLLGAFTAAGGRALEVVSGGNGAQHAESLATLATRFGLEGSVGSDFHSPEQTWNPLGRLAKLPDSVTPVWHGSRLTREHGRSAESFSS
ncbi:MAG TPA: PHP domain-containing protein [Steroidobacteraceae bacterium]|nr:PHP domain-containing protein [Steroidobacteraceae bacterium]